jgi:hypoxanthine phosphoribosyltransferase
MEHSLRIKTLISEKDIQKRVKEMGAALTDRFRGQEVVAICVLKGAYMFYADLIREMDCDMKCEFIGVSSYGNSMSSSGEVKLTLDVNTALEGKHVLIVEDIVDTGNTLDYLQRMISLRKPKSITTVSLLHKPEAKKVDYKLDMAGFKIPNDFVVGYGLDYQNAYRELPYIAQVEMN